MLPLKVVCILGSLVHTPNKEIITQLPQSGRFWENTEDEKIIIINSHPKSQQSSHGDL